MIRIIIGGDICPAGMIQNAFIEGYADKIFNNLLEEIITADLSIVNLECPLVTKETPIVKTGPVLGVTAKCINGFLSAKWNVLNLANNHSFDHGPKGLRETINTIHRNGLDYVGVGENIEEAQKPLIKEINGKRIVIFSMAEREFSIADEITSGANPLDIINFIYAIRKYKQNSIFIVLIHGGKEFYSYPSPEMIKRNRFMVDMGADAVICSHTHCPLPWEIYSDKPIIYGLGNLIFEPHLKANRSWYEGYLTRLKILNGHISFEIIPYIQSLDSIGVRKMNNEEKSLFFEEMEIKMNELKDITHIEKKWMNYCYNNKEIYYQSLYGYNKIMRKLISVFPILKHSKKERIRSLHLIQCETHQEILNTIFKMERKN